MTRMVSPLMPLLICVILTATLQGCGLRGDLYLPEEELATAPPAASPAMQQSEAGNDGETADTEGLANDSAEDEPDEDAAVSQPDTLQPPAP